MPSKYVVVSGVLFGVIAVLQAVRAVNQWAVHIGGFDVQPAVPDHHSVACSRRIRRRVVPETISDANALAYANSLLERDQKIHNLRVKYLAKFQTVVPTRVAARAIQPDRRLGLVGQVKVSSQVPLIP